MVTRLVGAVSPYLAAHADNPVDWYPWGSEAFEAAAARDVPVLVSIGYATCHWCHVMARESFSDPDVADYLNAHFVAIKVDREEHPDVDAAYLAAAGAFTDQLGWPLTVFTTPTGQTFHAATYLPPVPHPRSPSFRQTIEAVAEAWAERRDAVVAQASELRAALAQLTPPAPADLPDARMLAEAVARVSAQQDPEFGGFGAPPGFGGPKFPVAPVLGFLLEEGSPDALAVARTTLGAMAESPLFDAVDGGFFRYGTRRDWSEPHYERMLYDNAQLLRAYALLAVRDPDAAVCARAARVARAVAGYLVDDLAVPGGFASAQDSESVVDGVRVEGGYFTAARDRRRELVPPALDRKVLTGWNGLAIAALAEAGFRLGEERWVEAAASVADALWERHAAAGVDRLARASIDGRTSAAVATLEDYGMLADGLLALAEATGEVRFADRARALVEATLVPDAGDGLPFAAPGGVDPQLDRLGLAVEADPSEGAYPSGPTAIAAAALRLHRLTDDERHRAAALGWLARIGRVAVTAPIGFGAALELAAAAAAPVRQLLVLEDPLAGDTALTDVARRWVRAGATVARATPEQAAILAEAGFELYADRARIAGYLCEGFVCRLPVADARALADLLA